jgi:hypothetical protein
VFFPYQTVPRLDQEVVLTVDDGLNGMEQGRDEMIKREQEKGPESECDVTHHLMLPAIG